MRLADNLHKHQNVEPLVSAEPQNELRVPLRGDQMTVTHQARDELSPRKDLLNVHAPCVLTKLDGLFQPRGVDQIREVVRGVTAPVPIHQVDGLSFVLLERFRCLERVRQRESRVGRRCHGPVAIDAPVRVNGVDLVLEHGYELCEVLDAPVIEALGAVADVDVQARGFVDLDVEFSSHKVDDPADLMEALLADWKNARDELDACVLESVVHVVFVFVRSDA